MDDRPPYHVRIVGSLALERSVCVCPSLSGPTLAMLRIPCQASRAPTVFDPVFNVHLDAPARAPHL